MCLEFGVLWNVFDTKALQAEVRSSRHGIRIDSGAEVLCLLEWGIWCYSRIGEVHERGVPDHAIVSSLCRTVSRGLPQQGPSLLAAAQSAHSAIYSMLGVVEDARWLSDAML